jgi:hypothetical protein
MRTLPIAGLGLVVLLLSGCLPQPHTANPRPQPSSTPVFASDEDALAAAEAAYAEYLRVSDAITADGGGNPERIEPLVTPERAPAEADVFAKFASRQLHTRGATSFDTVSLQEYAEDGGGSATLALYLCIDVTEVRILDSSGSDVTPDRTNRLPLVVELRAKSGVPLLLVNRSDAWDGANFCGA